MAGGGGSGGTLPRCSTTRNLLALGPAWLEDVRREAIAKANELGLPTRKHEEWRYTNPKRIVETAYAPPQRDGEPDASAVDPDLDLDRPPGSCSSTARSRPMRRTSRPARRRDRPAVR